MYLYVGLPQVTKWICVVQCPSWWATRVKLQFSVPANFFFFPPTILPVARALMPSHVSVIFFDVRKSKKTSQTISNRAGTRRTTHNNNAKKVLFLFHNIQTSVLCTIKLYLIKRRYYVYTLWKQNHRHYRIKQTD